MKIAIFFSGETRTFNDVVRYDLLRFKNTMEGAGHTLDCFGIHWDDCEYPNEDLVKFKQINTVSQKILCDWVEADLENRAVINNGYARQRWTELYGMEFNKIPRDELIYSSYTSIAQVLGGWMALQMIPADYDLYIRWRWDAGLDMGADLVSNHLFRYLETLNNLSYETVKNSIIDVYLHTFISKIEDLAEGVGNFVPEFNVGAMALPTSVVGNGTERQTVDDVFFVITPKLKTQIDKHNIWDFFHEFLASKPFAYRPDGHNLWSDPIVSNFKFNFEFSLPLMISIFRKPDMQTESEIYQAYWDKYERTYGKPVIGKASCDPW